MAPALAVVVSGAGPLDAATGPALGDDAVVIAADSGTDHALAAGLPVHHVVGDLDSVSGAALARAEATGARVHQHPTGKDLTDLELALELAVAQRPGAILVLSGGGGRLDHVLAEALVLASPRWAPCPVTARMGAALVTVIRDRVQLVGHPGELVSLLPAAGPVSEVTTTGLRYPLTGEPLWPDRARGVSNVFEAATAEVRVAGGMLLVVQPGHQAGP